jgi:DNA polymerase
MEKGQYLAAMRQGWSSCTACGLCQDRQNVVFGYGNPNAQTMIIGEIPGENEDRQGVPFVGKAGRFLDLLLAMASARKEVTAIYDDIKKIRYEEDSIPYHVKLRNLLLDEYYFTNVVMCRPLEKRDPLPKEMEACRVRLLEEIYTVDPVVIVTAGSVASTAIVGKKVSTTSQQGDMRDVELPGRIIPVCYPVIPILHPSYVLRTNDLGERGLAAQTYNHLLRAAEIVDAFNLQHHGIPKPKRPKKEQVDDEEKRAPR